MPIESRYPREAALPGGGKATLRLMTPADGGAILAFASHLGHDDLLFLRRDITSKEGVADWIADLERGDTTSVLAVQGSEVLGYASVSRNPARWTRRVGEIRVNVAPSMRGRGLGAVLTRESFEVGRALGLKKLSAQMTPDQKAAQAAFSRLGFQMEALLTDWVEDRDGRPRDLLIMAFDLDGFTNFAD